jgi:hypothetical protein
MGLLENKPFDHAVQVHGARVGQPRNISSAREAAEEAGILIGDVDLVPKPGKVMKRRR